MATESLSITTQEPAPRPPSASEFFQNPKYETSSTEERLAALDKWAAYANDWVVANDPDFNPTKRAQQTARIREMRTTIKEGKTWQEATAETARDVGVSMAASGLGMAATATAAANVYLGETGDLEDLTNLVGEKTVKILDRLGENREVTDQEQVAQLESEGYTRKKKLAGGGYGAAATEIDYVDRREKLDNNIARLKAELDMGQYPEDPEAFVKWLNDSNETILREAAVYNGEPANTYTDQPERRFDGDLELQSLLSAYSKTRNDDVFAQIIQKLTASTTRAQSDRDTADVITESEGVVGEIRDKGETLDGPLARPLRALLQADGVSDATIDAMSDPTEQFSNVVSAVLTGGTAKVLGSAATSMGGKAAKVGANVVLDSAVEGATEAFQQYVEDSRGDVLEAAKKGALIGLAFQMTGAVAGGAKRAAGAVVDRISGVNAAPTAAPGAQPQEQAAQSAPVVDDQQSTPEAPQESPATAAAAVQRETQPPTQPTNEEEGMQREGQGEKVAPIEGIVYTGGASTLALDDREVGETGDYGGGLPYFTDSRGIATAYARGGDEGVLTDEGIPEGRAVHAATVSIDTPFFLDFEGRSDVAKTDQWSKLREIVRQKIGEFANKQLDFAEQADGFRDYNHVKISLIDPLGGKTEFRKALEEAGYDGIVAQLGMEGAKQYVPFRKEQIKLLPPDPTTNAAATATTSEPVVEQPQQSTGSAGQSSALASRAGGSGIRDPQQQPQTPAQNPSAFTLPAVVQLSKRLGLDPTVNPKLRNALGVFRRQGKTPQSVETMEGLFRDPDLAVEVLAHEVGHFIDYTAPTANRARLPKRIAPLGKKNWQNIFPGLAANIQGGQLTNAANQALKDEAVALSKQWRGDFPDTDKYRNSAPELYADFLSALLNAPQWTKQTAPNLYEGFFNALDQKPTVKAAYNEIQDLLSTNSLVPDLRNRVKQGRKEGIDKLIEVSKGDKKTLKERAKAGYTKARQQFLNKWAMVSAREGIVGRAKVGDSYTDKLEQNEGYATAQRALFNDSLRRDVDRVLDEAGVDQDFLHEYLIYNRIIQDTTATRDWIDQNPDEARELMLFLADYLSVEPETKNLLANAPDAELYKAGARMMREATLQANTRAKREAFEKRVRDIEEAGVNGGLLPAGMEPRAAKLINAFNIRQFMLNTEGIDVPTAQQALKDIEAELGLEKWAALNQAASNLHDIVKPITETAIDLGLYSEEVANEIIRPNMGNYIPFQVIEYFSGDVSASIKKGRGSVKALQDSVTAVSLNTQALLGWIQRQKTAMLLEDWAKRFSIPHEDKGPSSMFKKPDPSADEILIWRNGRPHILAIEEPGIGEAVNHFEQLDFLSSTLQALGGGFMGQVFTKYSIGFLVYTNALRGILTQMERMGYWPALKNHAASLKQAYNYAKAATLDAELTPEIRDLVDRNIIPPPNITFGRILTETEARDSLNAGLSAMDLARGRVRAVKNSTPQRVREFIDKPFVAVGAFMEALPKISAARLLTEKKDKQGRRVFNDAEVVKLARLEGIPNPFIGGSRARQIGALSLFYRVIVQGMRAERNYLANPKTRGGYMLRSGLTSVAPKVAMWMLATGAAGAMMKALGLVDEDDDNLEAFYDKLSWYKKEMGNVIPLGFTTPDNEFKWVWEDPASKEQWEGERQGWQAVGLRIPMSEGGRLWGSLAWNALAESNEDTATGNPSKSFLRWITNQAPGLNPAIELASMNKQVLVDEVNPVDTFRGRPIINHTDWAAGGWDRMKALLQWNAGHVFSPFYSPEVSGDTTGLSENQKALRQVGPIKAMLTFDNYDVAQKQAKERAEDERVAARTKKALGEHAVELLAQGSRLERAGSDNRTAAQQRRYELFLEFNRRFWEGKRGMRSSMIEAVKNGDKEQIEEISQDVEVEATRYLDYMRSIR